MTRSELLISLFDTSGKGLEIGPSFNPLLPKKDGYHVEILDHLSAEGLRAKYGEASVDVSRIEEVDYVSDGGSIARLIGKAGHFDYCVALHVIEHTVDLLGFLLDCQSLLTRDGVLVLAIPDKRFSFDVLRPVSTLGGVLQAHWDGGERHARGKVFDELAYNSLRAGIAAWPPGLKGDLSFFHSVEKVRELAEWLDSKGEFVDIHAWQFTPSSFRLLMHDLATMGFLDLREKNFVDVGWGEFFMTLSTTAAGCEVARMELALRAIDELNAISTREGDAAHPSA